MFYQGFGFTKKSRGFFQIFKNENSVFFKSVPSSCSENTRLVTRDHVQSTQIRIETPLHF